MKLQNWTLADWPEPRWNAYELSRLGEAAARQIDRDYLDNKIPAFSAIPKNIQLPEVLEVFPSRSLGNFFTGTLNFTSVAARCLIALGESDMTEILRQRGWLNVPNAASRVNSSS